MSETIILPPGGGRTYEIGPMRGVFKADEAGYCVSEWFLEPHCSGPGAHSHPEQDELFVVTEGTMWFLMGEQRSEAPAGTFLRIPAGMTHDFQNRSGTRAAAFNVLVPGLHFEARFAEWAS